MFDFLPFSFLNQSSNDQSIKTPLEAKDDEVLTVRDAFYMHEFISGQRGSNPGGLYKGSDGIDRYVKLYNHPSQAFCEHISNFIYSKLGITTPKSTVFFVDDKVFYASEFIPDLIEISEETLSRKTCEKIIRGLVADMLLANWDVLGLNYDNIALSNGNIIRLDNGGSLLFRAQGDRKPRHTVLALPEWESFFQYNPSYSRVLSTLNFQYPSNFPISYYQTNLDRIKKLISRSTWDEFLMKSLPELKSMNKSDFRLVVNMLQERVRLLGNRIATYSKELLAQSRIIEQLDPQITFLNSLSPFQQKALFQYTESPAINKLLRNIDTITRDFKLLKKNIDTIFKYIPPLEQDITVFRGVKFSSSDFSELNDFGFISTTYDKPIAFEFLHDHSCCLLEISISAGTKVIPLEPFSKYPDEKELLLPPGKFQVIKSFESIYFGKTITIHKVTYVPENHVDSHDQLMKYIRLVNLEINSNIFKRSPRHINRTIDDALNEVDRAMSVVHVPFVYKQDVKQYFSTAYKEYEESPEESEDVRGESRLDQEASPLPFLTGRESLFIHQIQQSDDFYSPLP